jgi:hypothetical protein
MPDPLSSPEEYQAFIYALPDRYPSVARSSLVYVPSGALFGQVVGMLVFAGNLLLCVQEYLNFELGVIEGYGYELSRSLTASGDTELPDGGEYCDPAYPHKEKLYWYDSFPHPKDPALESTQPHHKHIPPDIKHHCVPAPELSFTRPNLLLLIEEAERFGISDRE